MLYYIKYADFLHIRMSITFKEYHMIIEKKQILLLGKCTCCDSLCNQWPWSVVLFLPQSPNVKKRNSFALIPPALVLLWDAMEISTARMQVMKCSAQVRSDIQKCAELKLQWTSNLSKEYQFWVICYSCPTITSQYRIRVWVHVWNAWMFRQMGCCTPS